MASKQTAVQWLVEQLEQHHTSIDIKNTVVFQQAKEIEKQQINDAYWDGVCNWDDTKNSYYWEQYYLKTFQS